jgi:hypothetical protein
MFIEETYPFSRKLPGKQKFSQKQKFSRKPLRKQKFSRKTNNFRKTKFRENLLIFASFSLFAKMEKAVFVSTLDVIAQP